MLTVIAMQLITINSIITRFFTDFQHTVFRHAAVWTALAAAAAFKYKNNRISTQIPSLWESILPFHMFDFNMFFYTSIWLQKLPIKALVIHRLILKGQDFLWILTTMKKYINSLTTCQAYICSHTELVFLHVDIQWVFINVIIFPFKEEEKG